ncbi:MAG: type II toxin-antitoxin system MqsR family toxin [Desulfomicrobium sp.]|nr:type II toxin-antitoxin system MqsR family toxin [Desulfomicrobium sp.]
MKRPHEKPRRTYDLEDVKRLAQNENFKIAKSALQDAASLGMLTECVIDVILDLKLSDFHKSMTEHVSRNEIYLDVYHKEIENFMLYIKFKITNGDLLIITSFKER